MTHKLSAALCATSAAIDADALLTVLSPTECRNYALLRGKATQQQYLASRWLLRTHLSHVLDCAPSDVPLVHSSGQAPRLQQGEARLGLSHSGALCLCVHAERTAVGCDIEQHRPRTRLRKLAQQYFHASEAGYLKTLNETQCHADFYRFWTLKEATQKALGQGLANGLRVPTFTLQPELSCAAVPESGPWAFAAAEHAVGAQRYSLALAVQDESIPLELYEYRPSQRGHIRRTLRLDWRIALY